jgi:hypothetical protein
MELKFNTKETSKREQEEAFLRLSPSERFQRFLELSAQMALFEHRNTDRHKNNFILERHPEK